MASNCKSSDFVRQVFSWTIRACHEQVEAEGWAFGEASNLRLQRVIFTEFLEQTPNDQQQKL